MSKKRSLASILVLFVCLLASPPASAENISDEFSQDDAWIPPSNGISGFHAIVFTDQTIALPYSYLVDPLKGKPVDTRSTYLDNPTCASFSDPSCHPTNGLGFSAVFGVCKEQTDKNCVQEVEAINSEGKRFKATRAGNFPESPLNPFEGNPARHLPNGASASLWRIPEAPHPGGDLYLLSASVRGEIHGYENANVEMFLMNLSPVKISLVGKPCPYYDPRQAGKANGCFAGFKSGFQLIHDEPYNRDVWIPTSGGNLGTINCVDIDAELCAQKFSFPFNFRFSVKLRTNALPVGWLHGRLSQPDISITELGDQSLLTVEGSPVRVPIISAGYYWKDLPDPLKALYNPETGDPYGSIGWDGENVTRIPQTAEEHKNPLIRNSTITPKPSGDLGLNQMKAWLPYVNDKATASNSLWSVRTLESYEKTNANACFDSKSSITGIVTTNSTQYSAGPPAFSEQTGQLTYKVASPHFLSNGNEFKGSYDLLMASDVARCIYNFSKAPISATIEVVNDQNSIQIATTSLNEANGWVHLSANNFTFSSPTIRVKLSQDGSQNISSQNTPTVAPSTSKVAIVSPSKIKLKTIVCTKGKTIKKVTGPSPSCPNGYKRKT